MIVIKNAGQAIVSTNYWQAEHAAAGLFYLSWNAGAGRLLVPDVAIAELQEMRGADLVIVSSGLWAAQGGRPAIELLWEDGSDNPYCIHLVEEQTDRKIPETDQGGRMVIAAWTRQGMAAEWPAKYRRVSALHCLDPWIEH